MHSGTMINLGRGYVEQIWLECEDRRHRTSSITTRGLTPTQEAMYRHSDSVGTQQGNFGDLVNANDTAYQYSHSYDTQRSKYSSAQSDPAGVVHREKTEGGEWLNYTRLFDGSRNYNAYLRVAAAWRNPCGWTRSSARTQTAQRITWACLMSPAPPTTDHYRYIPLVTTNGALAVVNLSGTNTVRLDRQPAKPRHQERPVAELHGVGAGASTAPAARPLFVCDS